MYNILYNKYDTTLYNIYYKVLYNISYIIYNIYKVKHTHSPHSMPPWDKKPCMLSIVIVGILNLLLPL